MSLFAVNHNMRTERADGLAVEVRDFFDQARVHGIVALRGVEKFHLLLYGFDAAESRFLQVRIYRFAFVLERAGYFFNQATVLSATRGTS